MSAHRLPIWGSYVRRAGCASDPSIPCSPEMLERGSAIRADRLLCMSGQAEAIRRGGVAEVRDLVDLVAAQAQHGDSVGQVATRWVACIGTHRQLGVGRGRQEPPTRLA